MTFALSQLYTFLKAFLTGILISIGGIVFMSCDNKYIGAFLFGTGLFTILTFGLDLFTGKVGYVVNNKPRYLFYLLIVWLGNLTGTVLAAALVRFTRFYEPLKEKAQTIISAKTSDNLMSLLVLGFFCGMLMFIAADGYKNIENNIAKVCAIFLPVMVFIIAGFEHSIADMFYISMAESWDTNTIIRILIISAGNALGGIFIPLIRKCEPKKSEEKKHA